MIQEGTLTQTKTRGKDMDLRAIIIMKLVRYNDKTEFENQKKIYRSASRFMKSHLEITEN